MKKIIFILISLMVCLFLITGCYPEAEQSIQNSDNMTPIEDSEEQTQANETEEEPEIENRTAEENRALLEQLMQERGLNATEEEDEEEEEEEETGPGNYTIELINMRGEPEKNLEIKIGDSVTWISRQPNYAHRMQLRLKLDSGAFGDFILDPPAELHEDESFIYTFDEIGNYQWYSKTNYPTTSGYINVTE